MSQLLAFAFKRRRPVVVSDGDQCVPGVIASQNSTDTTNTNSTAATEWNENFICIPRRKGVTVTPEGLLPRKPLVELRADLLPHEEVRLIPIGSPTARDQENVPQQQQLVVSTCQNYQPKQQQQQQLPTRPSRSWSTRSSSYYHQRSWGSSSPSTTTHGNSPTWTAESPNLIPGQARTAVGNLVALQQQSCTTTTTMMMDPPGLTPVLQRQNDPYWTAAAAAADYDEEEAQRVETMFSPLSSCVPRVARDPSTGGVSGNNNKRNTSVLFSPVLSEKSCIQQNVIVNNNNNNTSSPAASSRKLICAMDDVAPNNNNNASGEATTTRMQQQQQQPMMISLDQDMKRIKARNQHQAKEELCLQVLERLQDNIELVKKIDGMFPWFGDNNSSSPEDDVQQGFITGFPEAMRYSISDKLDLLLNELNSGVQTEEFFFSPSKADMSEYNNNDHLELRKAVGFCKVLVQMAIPPEENETESIQGTSEVGQWRFLFREEIGLDIPQTPHKKTSSNSSFFSLPENEAATPMTSNVSLGASTLTSRPQLMAGLPAPPQNGLDMRHTLQSFIVAVSAMGDACRQFAATSTADGLVRTAETIKHTYASLMHETLDVLDLKFLVDAFEFVVDESTEIESPVMRVATLGSGRMMMSMDTSGSHHSTSFELMEDELRVVGSIDYSDDHNEDDDDDEESRDVFPGWDSANNNSMMQH